MSVDSAHHAALSLKKQEIAQTVLSRKRKLCELYAVATSAEPSPQRFDLHHLDLSPSSPLARFLDCNDLERNRYFQLSTLPPRPPHPPFILTNVGASLGQPAVDAHSPQDAAPLLSTPLLAASPRQPSTAASRESTPFNPDRDHKARESSPARAATTSQLPSAHDLEAKKPGQPKADVKAVAGGVDTQVAIEGRVSKTPPTFPKPASPQSPPYSPGTELSRPPSLPFGSAGPVRDNSINLPTPHRDEHDASSSVGDFSKLSKVDAEESVEDGNTIEEEARSTSHPRRPEDLGLVEPPSSPSSAPPLHSATTSRTDAHSTATSPDAETHSLHHVLGLNGAQPLQDGIDKTQFTRSLELVHINGNNQDLHHSGKLSSSYPSVTHQPKLRSTPSDQRLSRQRVSSQIQKLDDAHLSPSRATGLSVVQEKAVRDPEASRTSACVEKTTSPIFRVQKPPRKRQIPKLILQQPLRERNIRMLRALRKNKLSQDHGSIDRKRDYLEIMIAHKTLRDIYGADLHTLVKASHKTLSSSDWMTSVHEENDNRILNRIYHLQSTERWSLRRHKPSPEPTGSKTHWDILLKDMKWLQTDYREERKLKVAISGMLANWCLEYVNSSEQRKLELRTRASKTATVAHVGRGDHGLHGLKEYEDETDQQVSFFALPSNLAHYSTKPSILEKEVLRRLPIYDCPSSTMSRQEQQHKARVRFEIGSEWAKQLSGSAEESGKGCLNVAPEDVSCALFAEESKPLRARINSQWAFKPPTTPMPPQYFFEARNPSQWTVEEDQELKRLAREYPSNWLLIADRMAPKSSYTSSAERRTSWECFERLLTIGDPPSDAQTRQHFRQFHYRIEKARTAFNAQQEAVAHQAQQQAQAAGQSAQIIQQKRFPVPVRVERKQNRRLLAMLDSARRLRRNKELQQSKQQSSQQSDSQIQRPALPRNNAGNQAHTPQYFSRLKYEKECQEQERERQFRERQRAMQLEAQRQRHHAQQHNMHLSNGIGPQMRNNVTGAQVPTSGHPAVSNGSGSRPASQHPSLQSGISNGVPTNAQLGGNSRMPPNLQSHQRLAGQINASGPNDPQNMQRLVQHLHQKSAPQQTLQQHLQSQQQHPQQHSHGGPSMPNGNGLSTSGALASQISQHFENNSLRSPGVAQHPTNAAGAHQSPHMQQSHTQYNNQQGSQSLPQNQPQGLSSGHVPQLAALEHQVRNTYPQMSQQEVRSYATELLKRHLQQRQREQSRQNAINAASGLHGHSSQQAHQPQQAVGQTQNSYIGQSQQAQMSQQSPYQQPALLSSSYTQHQTPVGRSGSPVSVNTATMSSTPTQHQQQLQYQHQLRQHMYQQQQNVQAAQASGASISPASAGMTAGSPVMAMSNPAYGGSANHQRTPTPGGQMGVGATGTASMRPPSSSRSASTFDTGPTNGQLGTGFNLPSFGSGGGQGQGQGQGRPGSSSNNVGPSGTPVMGAGQAQMQSPRPISAQGFQ